MEKKYHFTWQNKWITSEARSIDDFVKVFENLSLKLKRWQELGVKLDLTSNIGGDFAIFEIEDEKIANVEGFKVVEN